MAAIWASSVETGLPSRVAFVELVWVLSSCYDLERAQVVAAMEALLRTKEVVVEGAEVV